MMVLYSSLAVLTAAWKVLPVFGSGGAEEAEEGEEHQEGTDLTTASNPTVGLDARHPRRTNF